MKLFLEPTFSEEDKGDGGVRRVIEALHRHLPAYDVELVDDIRQADVVNCHIIAGAQAERYLEQFPDIPLVASNHGLYWQEYEWPSWALKANAGCMELIRRAQAVTAPSEWVAQSIRRNTLRRVIPIGHGINLEEWPTGNHAGYVLWNKTRTDPVCDPEPVNELARRAPKVPFITTFGDESLRNVTVTGRLPYEDAHSLIQNATVYLATPRETFGIGTLEAMASGVPVLGWRWGGQQDIVQHGETGYLAAPYDYDDLAKGLEFCLANYFELGKAARAAVEQRYRWPQAVEHYAKLYHSLVAANLAPHPRVSVVVPAYGLEGYLRETLESVQAQTLEDWECVVVDDASPDRCGEIAEGFAARDERFRVIHNEENQYLAGALNTGMAAASGRYLLPLDADNLLPPKALELLAGELDHRRDLDIAYGNVEFLDPDGSRWHSGWPPPFRTAWQITHPGGDRRPNNLIPSTSMYRREVWELTGGYRRRWKTAEDADFWTRATSYGFRADRVTEADCLVYRNRDESMSRVENLRDWTLWYPWTRQLTLPPAGAALDPQPPIMSYEPVLVSVVIPVGPGHEELLIDALDSVDAQTFRLWEVIVVNDTGKPLRWLPSYARLVETSGGIGVAAARNLGVAAAEAKLFLPLDADDTLEFEALARLYETQREADGYVYCDWYERWEGRDITTWECPDYDSRLLLSKGCLHAVTALYPKWAWEQVGGFDEKLPAWEDWDFQLKLAAAGICGTRYPKPLFTYRKDTGKRRDENYADFEGSKEGILATWKPYFDGKERFMACGCGGKKLAVPAQTISRQTAIGQPPEEGEFVRIEFVGAQQGARTFRAPSGTIYRFSALPSEKVKMVRSEDAAWFLEKRDFQRVELKEPQPV